jgi:hypothetical protein
MLSNLKLAFVLFSLIVISEFNGFGVVNSQTPGSKGIKGKILFQQKHRINSLQIVTSDAWSFFLKLNKGSLTVVQTTPVLY